MNMVNSQKKGKDFEREVVRLLTALTGKQWHRVPNSGAFSTKYDVQDSRFKGDLYCEDEQYKDWLIECKITGDNLNLEALLNSTSPIWKWWKQATEEAKGKIPILIFRCKHSPTFAMMEQGEREQANRTETDRWSLLTDAKDIDGLVLGKLEAKA